MSRPSVVPSSRPAKTESPTTLTVGECAEIIDEVEDDLDSVCCVLELQVSALPGYSAEGSVIGLMEEKIHALARQLGKAKDALMSRARESGTTPTTHWTAVEVADLVDTARAIWELPATAHPGFWRALECVALTAAHPHDSRILKRLVARYQRAGVRWTQAFTEKLRKYVASLEPREGSAR